MVYGAADIRIAIADSGVAVVVGAVTTRGLDDALSEDLLAREGSAIMGRARELTLDATVSGLLAAVQAKADITVDGAARKVHSLELLDDGGLLRVVHVVRN